jgi:hypothetical protein
MILIIACCNEIIFLQDPFTHVYMYDLGFPPPLQQKIAENFNNRCVMFYCHSFDGSQVNSFIGIFCSVHCKYLISYRPPHRVLHEYGYLVTPIAQVPTSMHGKLLQLSVFEICCTC